MVLRYAKLHPNAKTPKFNPAENAGIDLFPCEEVRMYDVYKKPKAFGVNAFFDSSNHDLLEEAHYPRNTAVVPTGLAFDFPPGLHAVVMGRSGNAFKRDLIPFYGVVDASYRGEVKVKVYSLKKPEELESVIFTPEVAIAQMVFIPYFPYNLLEMELQEASPEELTQTSRNDRGFGSTGVI